MNLCSKTENVLWAPNVRTAALFNSEYFEQNRMEVSQSHCHLYFSGSNLSLDTDRASISVFQAATYKCSRFLS